MIEHRDADLTGSRFRNVDLSGTRIRSAFLKDVVITDAWLDGVRIEGEVSSLTVNGVDVAAYVEAELDRVWLGSTSTCRTTSPTRLAARA